MNRHRHVARAILVASWLLPPSLPIWRLSPTRPRSGCGSRKQRLGSSSRPQEAQPADGHDRNQKLKAIRDKYAGDSSRREKRAMFKEAQPVVDNYQARVRTILDDQQEVEWENMRAEAKKRLKEQYKSGNGPD